jgi:hypothetical protein
MAARLEDDVEVAVGFRPDEHDGGDDCVDVMLERQSSGGQVRRRRPGNQEVDRRLTRWQKVWPILKRLHSPTIAAAGSRGGRVARARR